MRKALYPIALAILIPCAGHSLVLYDIDFQTPGQGVNQTVQTGPAPQYVSSIVFGNPEVVSSFGGLTNQPLLFTGGSLVFGQNYYTQIQLNFGIPDPQTLDLSFDFTDMGTGHYLTLLFDTPEVRNFQFNQGGISFINPSLPTDNFGTYTMGQVYHFDVNVNFQQNDWTFYENGLALGAGTFNASSNVLRSIRFNYDATGPNISGTAIDNVTVTVPEPNLTSLVMAIGAAYTLWQRRPRVF
jgi:hypothetical protein